MAIAYVAQRASSSSSGATDISMTMAAGASVSVGNTLILILAMSNTNSPNPSSVFTSSTGYTIGDDTGENVWDLLFTSVEESAGAVTGTVVAVWRTVVQSAYANGEGPTWNGTTVDIFTPDVVWKILEFSGVSYSYYSPGGSDTNSGTGTTFTGVTVNPTAAGQLVIAAAGVETDDVNADFTADADVTNGAWSGLFAETYVGVNDADSQKLLAQYKIVTGAGAQTWNITSANSRDWANGIATLDVLVDTDPNPPPGNPDYPVVLGPEVLPTGNATLSLDTGTSYMFDHKLVPNSALTRNYAAGVEFVSKGLGVTTHHHVAHDVYLKGNEGIVDTPIEVVLPAVAVNVGTGAVIGGGTALNAIRVEGGSYIELDNGEYFDVQFNPSILTTNYPNSRILRVGFRYIAFKDDGVSSVPAEGMKVFYTDTLASNNNYYVRAPVSAWLVNNYQHDSQYELRWAGETCPIVPGIGALDKDVYSTDPFGPQFSGPFTVAALERMAVGIDNVSWRFQCDVGSALGSLIGVSYMEMVLEVVPERREATGIRLVSNAPQAQGNYPLTIQPTRVFEADDMNEYWTAGSDTNQEYVLVVREALPASGADFYRAILEGESQIAPMESYGPSLQIEAASMPYASMEPYPYVQRHPLSKGVFVGVPERVENYALGVVAFDEATILIDDPFFVGYQGISSPAFQTVYTGTSQGQYIRIADNPGVTTYDYIKVLCKPDALTTADLDITLYSAYPGTTTDTATITVADWEAATVLSNGWREVSVPLDTGVTPATNDVYAIVFSSTTSAGAPWTVAGGAPPNNLNRYGYNEQSITSPFSYVDLAVVLQSELDVPDVTLGTETVSLYRPTCITSTSTDVPSITFNNGSTYDFIAIERSVDAGTTYEDVILLTDPADSDVFYDYAVPWDVASVQYRITGYRDVDRRTAVTVTAAWAGTSTSPGAVFGLAYIECDSPALFTYVPGEDGGSELQVEYNPLNPTAYVKLHEVDYQRVLRSPEQRGMEMVFPILVDQIACDGLTIGNESLARGARALSPVLFDPVRDLITYDRMVLKLPGGHTRYVAVEIEGMSVKTNTGYYLATLRMTDVARPNIDPYNQTLY